MFMPLSGQPPSNISSAWDTVTPRDGCPPTAELFQQIPAILHLCLKFLCPEERARAALVNRQFKHTATSYFNRPVTQLYGPSRAEIGLPPKIFKYCLGFLGIDKKELPSAICANRAWQQNTLEHVIDSYCEPIIRFCQLLAPHTAPNSADNPQPSPHLSCNFRGCDSWHDIDRRISETKKKVIIELSKLSYVQTATLLNLYRKEAPPGFENVFVLALARTTLLSNAKKGLWSLGADESFKDDQELVYLFIKHSILNDSRRNHNSFELASERLHNKGSFVLAVIREVMPHYHPEMRERIMHQYVNERLSGDRDFMLDLLQLCPSAIGLASEELTNNSRFMLAAIRQDVLAIEHIGDQLEDDPLFMNSVKELTNNADFMLAAIRKDRQAAKHISPQLADNEEFMLSIFQRDPSTIRLASDRVRNNPKFMLAAVALNMDAAARHIGAQLRENDAFLLTMLKQHTRNELERIHVLSLASERLKNTSGFMLAVIHEFVQKRDLAIVAHAMRTAISPQFKGDEEFMTTLCQLYPPGVSSASEELTNNSRFMLAIIRQDMLAIEHLGNQLKNDSLFMSAIEELTNNGDFCLASIQRNSRAAQYIGLQLRDNEEFMWAAYPLSTSIIELASERLKNTSSFMLKVVQKSGITRAAEHISLQLLDNEEFMFKAIGLQMQAVEYIGEKLRDNDRFMSSVCQRDSSAARLLSERLKNDPNFMFQIIRQDARAAQFIGVQLRNHEKFMLAICKLDSSAVNLASERLRNKSSFMQAVTGDDEDDIYS